MKLVELLKGLSFSFAGAAEQLEISCPVTDSRSASPGSLFICIRGTHRDGHAYAAKAVALGAVACVCETPIPYLPCILVESTRYAAAVIWNNYFGRPGEGLRLVGITGTNGKTSTAAFLFSILNCAGIRTGTLGTLGCSYESFQRSLSQAENPDVPAAMTTPDPRDLYGTLAAMKKHGAQAVVMEVSSHALAQKKTAPLFFETGIFTNLSPEHLDFHRDMESYFQVKASLFSRCAISVINKDDPYGQRISGIQVGSFLTKDCKITSSGVFYTLQYQEHTLHIRSQIAGAFTVYNTMLAAVAALEMGVPGELVERGIAQVASISGRMERILCREHAGFDVYVDYAHTPAALCAALEGLRPSVSSGGRLTVLFGCGGDRDPAKRPIMGEIAGTLCDRVIVTSDNPRTEDRNAIIQDILSGMTAHRPDAVIPDRREAIIYAIQTSSPGDILLLAGKGHEDYETGPDGKHPFSERQIVEEAFKELIDKDEADG